MSTLVSTDSSRMPRSSQMPELPQPVPTSTTERAPIEAVKKRRAAPPEALTGGDSARWPASRAEVRGASSTAY
ncbi:hypothetical protein GCM10023405_42430 [Streptomonospora salina]